MDERKPLVEAMADEIADLKARIERAKSMYENYDDGDGVAIKKMWVALTDIDGKSREKALRGDSK